MPKVPKVEKLTKYEDKETNPFIFVFL